MTDSWAFEQISNYDDRLDFALIGIYFFNFIYLSWKIVTSEWQNLNIALELMDSQFACPAIIMQHKFCLLLIVKSQITAQWWHFPFLLFSFLLSSLLPVYYSMCSVVHLSLCLTEYSAQHLHSVTSAFKHFHLPPSASHILTLCVCVTIHQVICSSSQ